MARALALAALQRLCALLVLLLAAASAQAATYANASTTFSWIDSSGHTRIGYNTAPYKFNGNSAGFNCGTNPPKLDDAISDVIPIGFPFVFGTTSYTQLRVQTNGRIQFGTSVCGYGTTNIGPPQTYPYPLPDAALTDTMKVFGVDLDPTNLADQPNYPTAGSTTSCTSIATCYVSVATIGTAPNRQFVITWYHVPEWVTANNTSGTFDVQVVLNENGTFVYQYGTIVHGGTGTAEIGWELSTSDYDVLKFGAASEPSPNSAIIFYVPAAVLAHYQFEEGAWSANGAGQVQDSSGNALHGMVLGDAQAVDGAYVCRGANIPLDTSAGGVNAVQLGTTFATATQNIHGVGGLMFWIKTNGSWAGSGRSAQLVDAGTANGDWFYLVRRADGVLRFVITDSTGAVFSVQTSAQTFAAGTWQHVTITWNFNANPAANADGMAIYVNGSLAASSTFTADGSLAATLGNIVVGDNPSGFTGPDGSVNSADGVIDEVQVFNYLLSGAQLLARKSATHACKSFIIDHLELSASPWSGVACTPMVLTVVACADASYPCTSPYTEGTLVTLSTSGATTTWLSGETAAVAVGYGQSSATKRVYVAPGTATFGATASPSVTAATRCNGGGGSCAWTSVAAGLVVTLPDSYAETTNQVSVMAVKQSDSSLACTPAFANVTKSVNFKCSYTNPASGTLPVRLGGVALNAANNASAACDGSGGAVSLYFDATGTASTNLKYADAGRLTVTGTYTGNSSEGPLSMTGSGSISVAPFDFAVSGITTSSIAAGSSFSATVTARNYAGNATPNFGRESSPEGVTLAFVRSQPTGAGAVSGSFSGSTGAFSNGVASASNLSWSEVGSGNVVARLASGSYLGSGLTAAGSSQGAIVWCANEGGTCVLPSGVTATVYYATYTHGAAKVAAGLSGNVSCSNATFTDPYPGWGKGCWYVATGGPNANATAAATFKPHHFDVATSAGCGSFTYAGQPFGATVTARNASGATTYNYDGSASTSPNFAKTLTLTEAATLGLGSWSNNSIAAAGFSAGVGSASPSYAFTTKQTMPQSFTLRGVDADSVSSAGYAEGSVALRSGRLRLSNAFGSATASLQLPVTAEYWGGNAWVLNSADNCSALAAANVVVSNPRTAQGNTSTAATSAGALSLVNGQANLVLAAPSPAGASVSFDLALNLGGSSTDQSCQASHPASTGAAKTWLRSRNGNCASSWDRDPAGRASFGIFSPETRKTVHVREIF